MAVKEPYSTRFYEFLFQVSLWPESEFSGQGSLKVREFHDCHRRTRSSNEWASLGTSAWPSIDPLPRLTPKATITAIAAMTAKAPPPSGTRNLNRPLLPQAPILAAVLLSPQTPARFRVAQGALLLLGAILYLNTNLIEDGRAV